MRQGAVVARVMSAVVLSLAFSITLSASSLSGRLRANLFLDIGKTGASLKSDRWPSEIEMATEFRVDDWTFVNVTRFRLDEGLDIVKFAAAGTLGAFDVVSSMTFNELDGHFSSVAAARTSIGGLDLWDGATLWSRPSIGGVGFILGASGVVDSVEFYTDMALNMEGMVSGPIIRNGLDAMWRRLMLCARWGWQPRRASYRSAIPTCMPRSRWAVSTSRRGHPSGGARALASSMCGSPTSISGSAG